MKFALFRADGSHRLGLGHIMRCLALAESLGERGVRSVFATRDHEPNVFGLIRRYGHEIVKIPHGSSFAEDASLTLELASRDEVGMIVTDLDNSDSLTNLGEYQRYFEALGTAGKFMVIFDERIEADFPQAIQIIPYYGAEKKHPRSRGSARLLLGPKYFVFRGEFVTSAAVERTINKEARNILVTMGGSDPFNLTIKVTKTLTELRKAPSHLRIIIGMGFATSVRGEVKSILKGYKGDYKLIMDGNNMAGLMLWADLAVIAGGLTKYETAVTGTPTVIISQTSHEAEQAKEFEKGGSAIHLGLSSEVSEADIARVIERVLECDVLRAEMSRKGKEMVDGKGVERVISEIPQGVLS